MGKRLRKSLDIIICDSGQPTKYNVASTAPPSSQSTHASETLRRATGQQGLEGGKDAVVLVTQQGV